MEPPLPESEADSLDHQEGSSPFAPTLISVRLCRRYVPCAKDHLAKCALAYYFVGQANTKGVRVRYDQQVNADGADLTPPAFAARLTPPGVIARLAMFSLVLTATFILSAGPAPAATVLSPTSLGPLELGMSEESAEATGWVEYQGSWCAELYSPAPDLYSLAGEAAPEGLVGNVYFSNGRLKNIVVNSGAETALGISPGRSTTTAMVRRYRSAGYKVKSTYSRVFGGTFVEVRRKGRPAINGFARKGQKISVLGVPYTPLCE